MDYIRSLAEPSALVGLIASLIVLVSMCFNTRTHQGEILMRGVNLVGSIISVIYGLLLGLSLGAGVILLNGVLVFVNTFYLIKGLKK